MSTESATSRPVDKDHAISFNELRTRLQAGLDRLLTCLPTGDDSTIDTEYHARDGRPLGEFVSDSQEHSLVLLRDFSSMINTFLSLTRYPTKRIIEIMQDKEGAHLILTQSQEILVQKYVD